MEIKAIGNFVLVEKVRPANRLLDGIDLDSDNLFIFLVKSVGDGQLLPDGTRDPIPVKVGDEVLVLGQIVAIPGLIYGGDDKLHLVPAPQIAAIVTKREDWKPSPLIVAPGRVLGSREKQAVDNMRKVPGGALVG